MSWKTAVFACLLLGPFIPARGADQSAPPPHPLVWDAMEQTVEAKPGEETATFVFSVTNTSDQPIEVLEVQPSCGCTVAELPGGGRWNLGPGETGSFKAVVDYRGKSGKFSRSLFVNSTAGPQTLHVHVNIPDTPEGRRGRNLQLARMDRQAVFRGECANCHVVPTVGQTGEALFRTACGICHLAEPRATMVPDLRVARERRDRAYWERWISEGRENTLMPAFAAEKGGPLSAEQIASLVEHVMAALPREPASR